MPGERPMRRVEVVRPGGSVVVADSPGHGYVQRQMVVGGTPMLKRTYMNNGVPQANFYRPYAYRGVNLAAYTPVRYYRPAFYTYMNTPWAQPVAYGWGWSSRPWFASYGGYFTPYATYSSPAMWLTDYLIAAALEGGYQESFAAQSAGMGGYPGAAPDAVMDPGVKQGIAAEVAGQIQYEAAEQAAGYGGDPAAAMFTGGGNHVFVASGALQANSDGGGCWLRAGDVVRTSGLPPGDSAAAPALVLSSRGMDCPRGSTVWIGLADLQEMQNYMRATIDRGLYEMQSRQGQGGLPALPPGGAGALDSPLAAQAQPDANAGAELTSVYQGAARTEPQAASVYQPATPALALGLTIDEVKAIQGEPQKIVDLGEKKIYLYRDLKITFTGGRVTDIQ